MSIFKDIGKCSVPVLEIKFLAYCAEMLTQIIRLRLCVMCFVTAKLF